MIILLYILIYYFEIWMMILKERVWLCVGLYVCRFVCTNMHKYMEVRGQHQVPFLRKHPPCTLKQGLWMTCELDWLTRLAEDLLPQPLNCKHVSPYLPFYYGFWEWNSGPHACMESQCYLPNPKTVFWVRDCVISQTGIKLIVIALSQIPKHWDYSCESPCTSQI